MIENAQNKNQMKTDGYNKPLGRIIDFHSHILPGIDDGSSSVEESLQMIDTSVRQGVCSIVLTPHFYADRDNPSHFLKKRSLALNQLRENLRSAFPILLTGAEVQYFAGITSMDELHDMRIEKTDLLLLEMPFKRWTSRVINDVLELNSRGDCRVVIAHIERYIFEQQSGVYEELIRNNVLIQSNASFFTDRKTRRKALKYLENGYIHILGSDSHNMTSRPPELGECMKIIREKSGDETAERVLKNGFQLLLNR